MLADIGGRIRFVNIAKRRKEEGRLQISKCRSLSLSRRPL